MALIAITHIKGLITPFKHTTRAPPSTTPSNPYMGLYQVLGFVGFWEKGPLGQKGFYQVGGFGA